MEYIRSGNLSVAKLKRQIQEDLVLLEKKYPSKRVKRQIDDGDKFLKMIEKPPYKSCKTVSNLKKKISETRESLKAEIVKVDRFMPGHQISFFEKTGEITKEEQLEIAKEKEKIAEQIHWLHKCLGICANKKYFK